MRAFRLVITSLAFAGALTAGPALAVNNAPAFSPKPLWDGLPVLKISCTSKCIATQKKCFQSCLPGGHGLSCRQDCATKKVQCERACAGG